MGSYSRDKLKMVQSRCKQGNQYLEQGQIEAAQVEFQDALDFDSNSVEAHYGLARCYYRACLNANIAIDDGPRQNFIILGNEELAILSIYKRAQGIRTGVSASA